ATGGQVTVYYYSGNDDFGQDALNTALRTIDKLGKRFGVAGDQPVHIVIYGNNRDFATSLPPNSAEWIGGQAHPDLGLVVTGIDTDGLDRDWKASLGYKGDKPAANAGGGDAGAFAALARDGNVRSAVDVALPIVGFGVIIVGGLVVRRRRPAA